MYFVHYLEKNVGEKWSNVFSMTKIFPDQKFFQERFDCEDEFGDCILPGLKFYAGSNSTRFIFPQ